MTEEFFDKMWREEVGGFGSWLKGDLQIHGSEMINKYFIPKKWETRVIKKYIRPDYTISSPSSYMGKKLDG